jgi:type VI secretion system secreted protein VgrG
MKPKTLNLLAILAVAGTALVACAMVVIFANPYTFINPFPPPTLPALFDYPTFTPTLLRLPDTWTPTPRLEEDNIVRPTATPLPTKTQFVAPTFTITSTPTATATMTRTITRTPTNSPQPTYTQQPTYTLQPTYTEVVVITPDE